MSIYGEGVYACPHDSRQVYPQLRSAAQLERRAWDPRCPECGEVLQPVPTSEAKPLYPTSIYAINKMDQEMMCLVVGEAYGIPTVALRYFNVYGPRQALSNPYTGVAAIFSSRLLNGRAPLVFEDGRQLRDFVHVSDIVQANLLALDSAAADGLAVNVGTGRALSVLDVARALADGLGLDIEPEFTGQFRSGDIRHCYSDISRIESKLGYKPSVRFEDGMRELVDWVRGQETFDLVDTATRELAERGLVR
jgi:dTDP-L-rhamnose 4-epimerase